MTDLVGRKTELNTLEDFYHSNDPEFLVIYGRRRVGKTLLINTFSQDQSGVFFSVSGMRNAPLAEQLANFMERVGEVFYHGAPLQTVKNWREAYRALTRAIETVATNKKVILFFDELPWMAT